MEDRKIKVNLTYEDIKTICKNENEELFNLLDMNELQNEFMDLLDNYLSMVMYEDRTISIINNYIKNNVDLFYQVYYSKRYFERKRFAAIDTSLCILDKFNDLCDFELCVDSEEKNKYTLYDLQLEEFVFEESKTLENIVDIWGEKAYLYFSEEYKVFDNIDKIRKETYLQELKLVKELLKNKCYKMGE